MNSQLWEYLRRQAEKNKCRFILCDDVLYEVSKTRYSTGPSPLWSVDIISPKKVDSPKYYAKEDFYQ